MNGLDEILYGVEFANHEKSFVVAESLVDCMDKVKQWYHNEIDESADPEVISMQKYASTDGESTNSYNTTRQLIV